MDLLKLPTDNLYIFLTIGGLLMFVFFVSKLLKSFLDIKTRITKIKNEVSLVLVDSETFTNLFNVRSNVLDMHIEAYEKKYNIKFINPTDLEDESEHEKFSIPTNLEANLIDNYILDYEKIIDYSSKLMEENNNHRKSHTRLKNSTNETASLNSELKKQLIIYMIIISISLLTTIFGFFAWYLRNQKYQDGIIKAQYEQLISNKNINKPDTLKIAPTTLKKVPDTLELLQYQ